MKRRGLIDYRRGLMTVQNRARLETAACECYAVVWDRFEEFEGTLRKQA
jgi:hypothetical protein